MKKILVLGAGRSSSSLIKYLLANANAFKWKITVADASLELANQKIKNHQCATAVAFDVNNESQRSDLVASHDLVISLMPPPFHLQVAKSCIENSKHLLTASYVSPEIASLHNSAQEKNIIILMETGLDPGIDHMSAMSELKKIKEEGGKLFSFKSFTGGLIAPESDNNPWHYKITWNPRNVVLAGKGISTYLKDGSIAEIDYKNLFNTIETITVKGYGNFEGYPNRDSLKYLDTYQLQGLKTFLRGTLRRPGYCSAWNILIQLGFTDEVTKLIQSPDMTYRQLSELLLNKFEGGTLEDKLQSLGRREDVEKLKWLGILENNKINLQNVAPADALQKLMEERWVLIPGDKDMIVMQHQFEYEKNGDKKRLYSSLVVKGENEIETAMAKTVGIPLGIAAKLILTGNISLRGVHVPVLEELYLPILNELEDLGIKFQNEVEAINN